MDLDGLQEIVGRIERGELRTVAVETPSPSPMSHEILNANPFAFLDDAPLEERRARAVTLRRTDPDLAAGIGALDQAAIDEVRQQAQPDVRDADELHDHLLSVGLQPEEEAGAWGCARLMWRLRWPPWRGWGLCCAAGSRRGWWRRNGASAGCWPASTGSRWAGSAGRSRQSLPQTSCASCSAGSTSSRVRNSTAGTACSRSSVSCKGWSSRRRRGKSTSFPRVSASMIRLISSISACPVR